MKLLKIMLCWIFIPYVMVWRYMKRKGFSEKQYILMSVIVAFMWFGLVFSHNSVDTDEDKDVYAITEEAEETNDIDYEEVSDTKEATPTEEATPTLAPTTENPIDKERKTREKWLDDQFSSWNGSNYILSEAVRISLKNPDSFKHVETRYSENNLYENLETTNPQEKFISVTMTYRGTNSFNAVVTESVSCKISYPSGVPYDIIENK